jgi:AmmeMemoRadiSam system protein B
MSASVRHPAVAGRFYPADPESLLADVRSYLSSRAHPIAAFGCVVPHAGYMYSGHVAGEVYAKLEIPPRCIVMCPNHTGRGEALSIMKHGEWETPLGTVPINGDLATALLERDPELREDCEAHRSEHGTEVQLPFLQTRRSGVSFVPIALGTRHYESLALLGEAIAAVVAAQKDRVLVIASSDMNHYESDAITRVKDHKAIDSILALDPCALYERVMREQISMCGFGPTVAMLTAVKQLGAKKAELVNYATSGDISGDRDMVVGYAGVIVT